MTRLLALALLVLALLTAGSVALAAVDSERELEATRPRRCAGRAGAAKPVVLAFGGDVHFEGVLAEKLARLAVERARPDRARAGQADIAVVNLETAVTNGGAAAVEGVRLPRAAERVRRAPRRLGGRRVAREQPRDGLRRAGPPRLARGREALPVPGRRRGLDAKRAYAPFRATVNGQRIAVIGATQVLDDHLISAWTAGPGKPGLASAKDVPRLVQEVRRARRTADTVVVYLHWGVESEPCPSSRQRRLAKALVAAGADIIVGGHAHTAAGRRDGWAKALVGYGLGNFVWYGTSERLDAHRRPARHGDRPPDRRVPLGTRADRRRRPAAVAGRGAARRDRDVARAPGLHGL